jgi:NAD(P)-dependent dehydrogenase (short-subunit alcohol dehydrogenase family)
MVRTILITGCSDGGIGAALAQDFHRRGDRVFATARNISKIEPLGAIDIEILSSMSYPKIQSKLPVPNACYSTFCSWNALE